MPSHPRRGRTWRARLPHRSAEPFSSRFRYLLRVHRVAVTRATRPGTSCAHRTGAQAGREQSRQRHIGGRAMTASGGVRGVVNLLGRVTRRVGSAVSRRSPGRVLLALAELTLTQMGIPGAVAGCEYLTGWWGTFAGDSPRVPPASATTTPDHEGS